MILSSCRDIYVPNAWCSLWEVGSIQRISSTDQKVDGLVGAWGIALSLDSAHLYVTGSEDNSVVVFTRDTIGNFSASRQTIKNGDVLEDATTTMTGLGGAREVLISHDSEYVYVSAYEDDSLVVFERDEFTAKLRVIEILKNGKNDSFGNPINGLDGAWKMVASKDNKHLYVAGYEDDAIVVFERSNNGKLKIVQSIKNTDVNVQGIDGPRRIALGYNDLTMYVLGYESDSLAVFTRNSDGTITHTKAYSNGQKEDADNLIQYMDKPVGLRVITSVEDSLIANTEDVIMISSEQDDSLLYFQKNASGKVLLIHIGRDGRYYASDGTGRRHVAYLYSNDDYVVGKSGENFFMSIIGLFSVNSAQNRIYYYNSAKYNLLGPKEIIGKDDNIYVTGSKDSAVVIFHLEKKSNDDNCESFFPI